MTPINDVNNVNNYFGADVTRIPGVTDALMNDGFNIGCISGDATSSTSTAQTNANGNSNMINPLAYTSTNPLESSDITNSTSSTSSSSSSTSSSSTEVIYQSNPVLLDVPATAVPSPPATAVQPYDPTAIITADSATASDVKRGLARMRRVAGG